MVHRHNVYVSVRVPVDGGQSPNSYAPQITVEIRAFWPPYLGHEDQVVDLISKAAEEATRRVFTDPNTYPRNTWLVEFDHGSHSDTTEAEIPG